MSLALSRSNTKNCFVAVINVLAHQVELVYYLSYPRSKLDAWWIVYKVNSHERLYAPIIMVIYILVVSWMTSMRCTKKMMISHLLLM
jgi:hypothetical protein